MHTHRLAHTHTHTNTHTYTPVIYQGNETEEKIFKKRKVFKEDLKELTEVQWRTETGIWFQITGALLLRGLDAKLRLLKMTPHIFLLFFSFFFYTLNWIALLAGKLNEVKDYDSYY